MLIINHQKANKIIRFRSFFVVAIFTNKNVEPYHQRRRKKYEAQKRKEKNCDIDWSQQCQFIIYQGQTDSLVTKVEAIFKSQRATKRIEGWKKKLEKIRS